MKLQGWYLYNSTFVLKTQTHCSISDYYPYAGEPRTGFLGSGRLDLQQVREFDLPVTVFVSHARYDHFDKSIFTWQEEFPGIHYVLSSDVPAPYGLSSDFVLMVQVGQQYEWNGLVIRTLLSTDQGVAFLIRIPGAVIYHAGGLNFWDWEGESDAYRRQMEQDYREQIDCIAEERVDLAFVPPDGRLERTYWKGLDYLVRVTGTHHAVPMHFRDQYGVFDWLRRQPEAQDYLSQVQVLTHQDQPFLFDVK